MTAVVVQPVPAVPVVLVNQPNFFTSLGNAASSGVNWLTVNTKQVAGSMYNALSRVSSSVSNFFSYTAATFSQWARSSFAGCVAAKNQISALPAQGKVAILAAIALSAALSALVANALNKPAPVLTEEEMAAEQTRIAGTAITEQTKLEQRQANAAIDAEAARKRALVNAHTQQVEDVVNDAEATADINAANANGFSQASAVATESSSVKVTTS